MKDCLFCKIIAGEIPSTKVYEDDDMIVIKDINPQAKVHLLLIPKEHFANVTELNEKRAATLGRCLMKITSMQKELGLTNGFRLITNAGADACQSVFHLHIHILGGEQLAEKMG